MILSGDLIELDTTLPRGLYDDCVGATVQCVRDPQHIDDSSTDLAFELRSHIHLKLSYKGEYSICILYSHDIIFNCHEPNMGSTVRPVN